MTCGINIMYFIISVQFIVREILAKNRCNYFFFFKEEWKCVLTPGVPYFIQGVSRNALKNFNSEFLTSKQRQKCIKSHVQTSMVT